MVLPERLKETRELYNLTTDTMEYEQLTEAEYDLAVMRLLELIRRKKEALARHQQNEQPDGLAVLQYQDLLNGYLAELMELLRDKYGLVGELHPDVNRAA